MKYIKTSFGYLIRMDLGEKITEGLKVFVDEKGIASACLWALGALKNAKMSFYDLPSKKYRYYTVDYPVEVVSFFGNVSRMEDSVIIHVHASFSDQNGKVIGGHFVEGEVGPTLEVLIMVDKGGLSRAFDERIGLNLLDLGK